MSTEIEEPRRDCGECPVMVSLPGGTFTMGSPEDEEGRDDNESPQHHVTVPAFALGKYPVTFAQWDASVAEGGCSYRPGDEGWGRGNRPVINVSWQDTQEYVSWLSDKTGREYRLPTEAEWEYAARAGATTPFHTGKTITPDQANYDGNYRYGGGPKGIHREQTVDVGSFGANKFGLHDMHGNVWEWVEDCYQDSYRGVPADGSAWLQGDRSWRVLRGGSWYYAPVLLRSANRGWNRPGARSFDIGFRVARGMTP